MRWSRAWDLMGRSLNNNFDRQRTGQESFPGSEDRGQRGCRDVESVVPIEHHFMATTTRETSCSNLFLCKNIHI